MTDDTLPLLSRLPVIARADLFSTFTRYHRLITNTYKEIIAIRSSTHCSKPRIMSLRRQEEVGDRDEWILRLLYAPDKYGRTNTPLYGKTRLMKATFLMDRKLAENFGCQTGFNFEPHKYGPFDRGVLIAVEQLEQESLVYITEPSNHNESYDLVKYELTNRGTKRGRQLYTGIPKDQQKLIQWIKNERAMQKLGRLLTSVYNEYPEMTVESELI